MRYQSYPKYKESGINYQETTPDHWVVKQLKRTVDGCVNGIWGSEPVGDGSDMIVLRVADFNRQKLSINLDKVTYRKIADSEKIRRKLKKGDLLLEKSGGGEKTLVGQVVLFDKDIDAITSNFVAKMTPLQSYDSAYLNYVFARFYAEKINYCSIKQNTGIQNLDSSQYLSEKFAFPVIEEQTQIATFLDRETQKIDRLIEKQQQLIKLLQEKRQAVISHAVTKGLNPNVKMKDSGVEWFGNIPEHWDVKPLKSIGGILSGYAFDSAWFVDQGVRVLKISNIQTLKLDWSDESYVDENVFDELKRFAVLNGDIVFALTRPIISTGIKVAIAEIGNEKVLLNQRNACFRLFDGNLKAFFYHVLFSQYFISLFENSIDATGQQPNISPIDIGNIKVFCPALNEQVQISEFLDCETKKIALLIEKCKEAIQLSQERRTALISAAVTGKIDVRNISMDDTEKATTKRDAITA